VPEFIDREAIYRADETHPAIPGKYFTSLGRLLSRTTRAPCRRMMCAFGQREITAMQASVKPPTCSRRLIAALT
jgi:hypothetical protein